MKKVAMIALMYVPSVVYGMEMQDGNAIKQVKTFERQKAELAIKLKLVLTAGTCVYQEHQAIHWDVVNRTKKISTLLLKKDYEQLATALDEHAQMLHKALEVYTTHCPHKDIQITSQLESAHRNCLTWALAFPQATKYSLSQESLGKFQKAVTAKKGRAANLYKQAGSRQHAFEHGIERSMLIPIDSAITAWCVELPAPIFESSTLNQASLEPSNNSSKEEEINGLFESFYGDVE